MTQKENSRATIIREGNVRIDPWNINENPRTRACGDQLCEWLEHDRPDIICLQEWKAGAAQIPPQCDLADYHADRHGVKGYFGFCCTSIATCGVPIPFSAAPVRHD